MNAQTRMERLAGTLKSARGPVDVVGAQGGFAGLVLAGLRRGLDRPLVVVVPDDEAAETIHDSLRFFEPTGGLLDPVVSIRTLDATPFVGMSPSRVHVMDRVTALYRIAEGLDVHAVVVAAPALLDRVPPRHMFHEQSWYLAQEEVLDRDAFAAYLAAVGYHAVSAVEDPGTFAIRGGIVDVYSPLYELPLRIDLWGDEVDSLRLFDPTDQKTVENIAQAVVGPCRDIVFTDETLSHARTALAALADARTVPSRRLRAVQEDVDHGVLAVGMEELLPAFYEELDPMARAMPAGAAWLVVEPERCAEAMVARWEDIARRNAAALQEDGSLVYDAVDLFVPAPDAAADLTRRAAVRLRPFELAGSDATKSVRFQVSDNSDIRKAIEERSREGDEHILAPLTRQVRAWRARSWAVVVCAHTEGGAEKLQGLLGHYGLKVERQAGEFDLDRAAALSEGEAEVALFVGEPGQGFRSEELGLVVLDEAEILGRKQRRRRGKWRVSPEQALASWRDLREGDFIVHLHHGIGKYLGLQKTAVSGIETDFLVLEYADANKLFVPVDRLHLVSKHVAGDGPAPRVDKLGGTGWQRTTRKVKKAVRDIADKLLKLYAEREMRQGHPFQRPGEYFAAFEAAFPYEETPDQARAIEEVLEDMQKPRPMDRLVCGDVGFGKTEVAMRAAFLAVLEGKQVAVLVPTVVLAEQHKLTFQRRFAGFPVTIDSYTRSKSPSEAKEVRERLESGRLDIVVGTHRLLGKSVKFRDVGLIVVDEEHRFGVAHKERLKEYRTSVDVLTLTATPIPRTLHLSMVGLRDISLIQTPPAERLAIRTMVARPTEEVISETIERELARGGQVYYVHNRVEDIEEHAELIRRLVPRARIDIGHGQMERGALEQVMLRFMRGETNVLVCTTIIESGIDIPNANTMLVHRADRFGLAQLYQLRGRIGRSSERAYCYLLIPSPAALTGDAAARIAAIQRFTELGSGFSIASYDLDIRGAGDILGADQSGQIDAVGYDAYMQMLQEAIEDLRGGEERREQLDPELKVAVEGRIPSTWLPDTTLRLRLYRRLASAPSVEAIYDVYREALDRYGRAPEPVKNLVDLMVVKQRAKELGVASVGFNAAQLSLGVTDVGPLSAPALMAYMAAHEGAGWRLSPQMQLTRPVTPSEWARGLDALTDSLKDLAGFASRFGSRDGARP